MEFLEVFENQRWFPVAGWSSKLLPTDRDKYSLRDGSKIPFAFPTSDVSPLDGFRFKGCWFVDENPEGPDVFELPLPTGPEHAEGSSESSSGGWVYSIDFPDSFAWAKSSSVKHCVRRRRWLRLLEPAPGAAVCVPSTERPDDSQVGVPLRSLVPVHVLSTKHHEVPSALSGWLAEMPSGSSTHRGEKPPLWRFVLREGNVTSWRSRSGAPDEELCVTESPVWIVATKDVHATSIHVDADGPPVGLTLVGGAIAQPLSLKSAGPDVPCQPSITTWLSVFESEEQRNSRLKTRQNMLNTVKSGASMGVRYLFGAFGGSVGWHLGKDVTQSATHAMGLHGHRR